MRRVYAVTRRTRSAATDALLGCMVAAGEHFAAATTAKLEAVA
jgi:hypothetical protein